MPNYIDETRRIVESTIIVFKPGVPEKPGGESPQNPL
jgi:hypothetical protein